MIFPLMLSSLLWLTAWAESPANTQVSVRITRLRSTNGQVGVLVFNQSGGFPSDPTLSVNQVLVPARATELVQTFSLPAGTYAFTVMHDENGNGRLDTNLFGIPTEGYGFSRDATGFLGPPSYESAAVKISGPTASVSITMNY